MGMFDYVNVNLGNGIEFKGQTKCMDCEFDTYCIDSKSIKYYQHHLDQRPNYEPDVLDLTEDDFSVCSVSSGNEYTFKFIDGKLTSFNCHKLLDNFPKHLFVKGLYGYDYIGELG